MLQALVNNLKSLPNVQVLTPLMHTIVKTDCFTDIQVKLIDDSGLLPVLPDLIRQCDAVWPIAPESNGILANIAELTLSQGKILLLSSVEAVAICTDKMQTHRHLSAHNIPAVPTFALNHAGLLSYPQVIKPIDGVGCQGAMLIETAQEFQTAVSSFANLADYIIQPYCAGQAVSLSCLFKNGQAWILCCNQQQIEISHKAFHLHGCRVNISSRYKVYYQLLVEKIAHALPGLWGYVGIDLIETDNQGPLLLEINPRLTTSFIGIQAATGINLAEQVLRLLDGEVEILPEFNRIAEVVIH